MDLQSEKMTFEQSTKEDFDDIEIVLEGVEIDASDYLVALVSSNEIIAEFSNGSGLVIEENKIFILGDFLQSEFEKGIEKKLQLVFFRLKEGRKKIWFGIDYLITTSFLFGSSSKSGKVQIVNENKVINVQINEVNNYGTGLGLRGKNNYELYLENTSESPPKTLSEWIESLKVKGDPGLPFQFKDLTFEQAELIKGEKGNPGKNLFEVWKVENPSGTFQQYLNTIKQMKKIRLNSNFENSTNVFQEVEEFQFNLESGKDYRMQMIGSVQSIITTTGVQIAFTFDGNLIVNGFIEASITHINSPSSNIKSTIYSIDNSTATAGSNILTTGVGLANLPMAIKAEMIINCIDGGLFKTFFASEINGSKAQINIGTTILLEEI